MIIVIHRSVRIWSIAAAELTHVLHGHTDEIEVIVWGVPRPHLSASTFYFSHFLFEIVSLFGLCWLCIIFHLFTQLVYGIFAAKQVYWHQLRLLF